MAREREKEKETKMTAGTSKNILGYSLSAVDSSSSFLDPEQTRITLTLPGEQGSSSVKFIGSK